MAGAMQLAGAAGMATGGGISGQGGWDVLNLIPSGAGAATAPTVFELILQTRLSLSFRPAFDYLLDTTVIPLVPALVRFAQWRDELFVALAAAIEARYLTTVDASFTEHLYGFRRTTIPRALATVRPLSRGQVLWSLFQVVGVPYVMHKLARIHRRMVEEAVTNPVQAHSHDGSSIDASGQARRTMSWMQHVRAWFLRYFPMVNSGYMLLQLVYHWMYAWGKTPYFDLWFRLANLAIVRMSPSDALAFEARAATSAGSAPSALQPQTRLQRLLAGLRSAGSIGLTVGRYGLLAALVAFKLAEWWFTNEEALYPTAASGTARALVPAPLPPSQHPGAVVALPKHRGKCPLCRKLRTNPAASSAGVVYCYGCIFKHASKHGTCAATGQPCSVEQIRKLHTN